MSTPEETAAARQADENRSAELKRQLEIKDLEHKLRPVFLSTWNDRLTAIGTAVATFAAIASAYNTWQINRLSAREKVEQASYRFADLFVGKILAAKNLEGNKKTVQAMLAILDIVAQASSSEKGDSRAESRELLPIRLALLLSEPGGVIELDPEGRHLDDWVGLAESDNHDDTRVTAMRALAQLGQKALISGRLDILQKVVRAMSHLRQFIPEGGTDEAAKVRSSALTARSQLGIFISTNAAAMQQAHFPKDTGGDATAARKEIEAEFPNAVASAQQTRQQVQEQLLEIEGKAGSFGANSGPVPLAGELRQNLATLDVAIAKAADAAVRKSGSTQPSASANISASAPAEKESVTRQASTLAAQLASEDEGQRQAARSELALLGNFAVKPLLTKVDLTAPTVPAEKLNFEVGLTLGQMRQPIFLDKEAAAAAVGLLRLDSVEDSDPSKDRARQTRRNVAAFLMDLGDGPTIRATWDELKKAFDFGVANPKKGSTAFNAALVVGTWARNLVPGIQSPTEGKAMRDQCLDTAREWRKRLRSDTNHPDGWNTTLSTLDDLIARAESVRQPTQTAQPLPQAAAPGER